MRVLIVIDDLRRAGAQRVIVQEIQALHPHAIHFQVVALNRVPEPSFERDLTSVRVRVDYLPGAGLLDVRRVAALRRLIMQLNPDLVHTHLTYANVLGTLAAVLAGRPVVASLHNFDTNQLRWPTLKRSLEGFVLRHWASCNVFVCATSRRATSRTFGVPEHRTALVQNAVDPASIRLPSAFDRTHKRLELGVLPDEQLVSCVARLEPSKGHRFLLAALAILVSRSPRSRIRLALIGGGPEEQRIRELAVELGIADRLMLLGIRDDVAEILSASDLFVLPSLNEGLSQALLEAMALCVPVVATNVGGTPDVVQPGRTGWRVMPGEPRALADAIQQALAKPDTAAAYARAAHAFITQGFSLPTHLSTLQAVYRSFATA